MARGTIRPVITLAVAVGTMASAVVLTSASVSAASRPSGNVAGVSSLNAISCPIATHCLAVGADVSGNGKSAVVNTSNASATVWAGSTRLHQWGAIACAVPERCVAVATGVTGEVTVANGATRVVSTLHVPSNQIAAMGAIACPNSTSCYAVGFEGTEASSKALVAHLASTGALLGTTLEASSSGIGAIACPTSTRCLIAAANRAHPEKIQLLENGHLGPARAIPAKTYVQAMACDRAAACYFLGGKTTGQKTNLLYAISPTTGAVESEATIGGSCSGTGIACPNANRCLIVGFTAGGKPAVIVATHGKPGAPSRVGGTGLTDIGCTASGACFGVGQSGPIGLVERV